MKVDQQNLIQTIFNHNTEFRIIQCNVIYSNYNFIYIPWSTFPSLLIPLCILIKLSLLTLRDAMTDMLKKRRTKRHSYQSGFATLPHQPGLIRRVTNSIPHHCGIGANWHGTLQMDTLRSSTLIFCFQQ